MLYFLHFCIAQNEINHIHERSQVFLAFKIELDFLYFFEASC